jgi:hypothetical protein
MSDVPDSVPKSAFTEAGLPIWSGGEHGLASLKFSVAAQALIAEVVKTGPNPSKRRRLFVRTLEATRYTEVHPSSGYYFTQVVTCESLSVAFVMEVSAEGWFQASSMSLPDGQLTKLGEPAVSTRYERQWISSLIHASADGSALYVIAGFQWPAPSGLGRIEYHVARYVLATGQLVDIAGIATPFA